MIQDYLRKDLLGFKPYHAPLKPYEIKVDANENPFPHSPVVLERIKKWLDDKDHLTRYPDTDTHELREKLAAFHQVTKEEIICTVGSDQLIELLIKVFIEPGEVVLVPNPSFSMYTLSTVLNHGKAVPYELDDNFDYDYDKIIDMVKIYTPKLLFICTPNNPTGNKATIEGMRKVLDKVKCPIIIDEAYEEFIGESMIDFIHEYPNLMVLRTFSKAYGLAGLRIGYGIANDEFIEMVNIAKPPYNLNAFSQMVACAILDQADYYMAQVVELVALKNKLVLDLTSIPIIERVYPTTGNFILIKVKNPAITTYMLDNRVLIRPYGNAGRLTNHVRITVGSAEENQRIITLLNNFTG